MEQLQRTEKWFNERLYKFTSSNIFKLFTEPRTKAAKEAGELSETAKGYILEKIAEELGVEKPEFTTKEMQWGIEQEPNAKMWYEIKTRRKVGEVGFCMYNEFFGGSPDAAVYDSLVPEAAEGVVNCGLEIKCPYNTVNHLKHCLIDSPEYFKQHHPEYYWQCVAHMIVLNVGYCDFVSFDPRIDNEIGLFIFRLNFSSEDAAELLLKIPAAVQYKEYLRAKLGLTSGVIAGYEKELNATIIGRI